MAYVCTPKTMDLTTYFFTAITEQFETRISDDKNDEWCLDLKNRIEGSGHWETVISDFIDEIIEMENVQSDAFKYAISSSVDYDFLYRNLKEFMDDLSVGDSEDEDSE